MNNRLAYIDVIRLISIIFVIVLHVTTDIINNPDYYMSHTWIFCVIQNAFNRCGVPLFFMISGFLNLSVPGTDKIKGFYSERFRRILPSLFIWNVIYFVYHILTGEADSIGTFFYELFVQGNAYHMWFVYEMIGLYLISPFLRKILDHSTRSEQLILFFFCIFTTTIRPLINITLKTQVLLIDDLVFGYAGYYLLGYILGSYEIVPKAEIVICCGGVIGLIVEVTGNIMACSGTEIVLPYNGGYMFNHYLLAAALFILAKNHLTQSRLKNAALRKVLAKLSDVTFGVYWVHVMVQELLVNVSVGSVFWTMMLQIVLITVICYAMMLVASLNPILKKYLM